MDWNWFQTQWQELGHLGDGQVTLITAAFGAIAYSIKFLYQVRKKRIDAKKLSDDNKQSTIAIPPQPLTNQQLLQHAKQATLTNAYDEAITLWQQVKEQIPEQATQAEKEITALQEAQQEYLKTEKIRSQLTKRMQEIQPIFYNIVQILNDVKHPQRPAILQKIKLFLQRDLNAEDFIKICKTEIAKPIHVTNTASSTSVNYAKLANRIRNGRTVLFIGSGIPKEYGEFIPDQHELAQTLADSINYTPFKGSLPSIAEYYQLRPLEFGQEKLLNGLKDILLDKAAASVLYQQLAQIEEPLLLISSNYDDKLEKAFQQHNKPYATLTSIINRNQGYDIGKIVVHYSDEDLADDILKQEDLSDLALLEEGYSLIYKIKGTCDTDTKKQNATLLLTESDYFNFAQHSNQILPAYVVSCINERGFMFIGFNPKSWEDRLLANALLDKRENKTDPCFTASSSDDPLENAYWEKKNVQRCNINIQELDKKLAEVMA